jgi:lysophospholipase L1-like esterase
MTNEFHAKQPALSRRSFLAATAAGAVAAGALLRYRRETGMITVYTFGDSILDCGRYNDYGVTPGQLIVRNDDRLFPEFRGQDLESRGPARLEHRAQDGATVNGLARQAQGLRADGSSIALLTVGGNDLLQGLITDKGAGIERFRQTLGAFLRSLPIRPVLIGTVYDPSFGDDRRNFLGVDPAIARANHRRVDAILAEAAGEYGELVDIHKHFLTGDPSWYTRTIEPSLRGASEVRRAFWPHVVKHSSQ